MVEVRFVHRSDTNHIVFGILNNKKQGKMKAKSIVLLIVIVVLGYISLAVNAADHFIVWLLAILAFVAAVYRFIKTM